MELLNLIRRMSLREKLPIREIARRTGLSRNTVKKHLNAGTVEPMFAISVRPSKLDPFAGLCCTNPVRDSSCESSVVAGMDEQTEHTDLQDPELVRVQQGAQVPGVADDLV